MSSTAATGSLHAAILAVQAEMPTMPKDGRNPAFGGSKYTKLDTIVEAVTPFLTKHGLTWTTCPSYDRETGHPTLSYALTHVESGAAIEDSMLLLNPKNDPQGQGSAITYARRQAITAALNIVADEDVDGNMPGQAPATKPVPQKPAAPKTLTAAQVKKAEGLLADVDPTKVQLLLTAYGVNDLPELTGAQVKELIAKATA